MSGRNFEPVVGVEPGMPPLPQVNLRVSPSMFGGLTAQAGEKLGAAAEQAGSNLMQPAIAIQQLHNEVAGDQAFNEYQKQATSLVFGDPNIPGDRGYMGLQGADALDGGKTLLNRLEQTRQTIMGSMQNDAQRLLFDQNSRRFNYGIQERVANHADTQWQTWAVKTQIAGEQVKLGAIAADPANEDAFQHNLADLQATARKKALIAGGNEDMVAAEQQRVTQTAYAERAKALGALDANAALQFVENNRDKMDPGTVLTLKSHFETLSRRGTSSAAADAAYNGTPMPPASGPSAPRAVVTPGEGNTRGERARNLMNLTFNNQPGAAGEASHPAGGVQLAVFNTQEEGYAASAQQVLRNQEVHGAQTVRDLVKMWERGRSPTAPPPDEDYVRDVARTMGVSPDAPVDMRQPGMLLKYMEGTVPHETTRNFDVAPMQRGIAMALGGTPLLSDQQPKTVTTPTGAPIVQAAATTTAPTQQQIVVPPDRQQAYQRIMDQHYDPQTEEDAINRLSRRFAIEDKAKKDAQDKAHDEWVPQIIKDPLSVDPNKIADDPRLDGQQKWQLTQMLKQSMNNEPKIAVVSHQTATALIADMRRPEGDPQRVTDLSPVYTAYQQGRLSNADFGFVQNQFKEMQTEDGQRLNTTMDNFLKAVKQSVDKSNPLMGQLDMTGGTEFFRLQQDIAAKVAQYRKDGKDPYDLFNPAKPDYLGRPEALEQYQRSMPESMEAIASRLRQQSARPTQMAPRDEGAAAAAGTTMGSYAGSHFPIETQKPRPPLESIFGPMPGAR